MWSPLVSTSCLEIVVDVNGQLIAMFPFIGSSTKPLAIIKECQTPCSFKLSKSPPPSTNIDDEDLLKPCSCLMYFSGFSKFKCSAIRLIVSLIVWQPA